MKLTPKQKRLAAVLGVCLAVLALDRVLLGPDSAEADQNQPAAAAPPPNAGAEVSLDENPAIGPGALQALASRLEEIDATRGFDPMNVPDAFRPAQAWLPTPQTVAAETTIEVDAAIRAFRDAHRLNAILAHGEGGCVVVDGTTVRLGELVGGYRLIKVTPAAALFETDGIRIALPLPRPGR